MNLTLAKAIAHLTLLGVPSTRYQEILNLSHSKFGRVTKNSLETVWYASKSTR